MMARTHRYMPSAPRVSHHARKNVMGWPTPQFSKSDINRAGTILADPNSPIDLLEWAHEVLGNWRACHGYPLNTFKVTLYDKLERLDPRAIMAQRLKRTPSIIEKLKRFPTMQLARMQDIGGLRAVVSTLTHVRQLRDACRSTRIKHDLVNEKDYIVNPKSDGYRSVHLVFRYKNSVAPDYEGLSVELQIRTKLQHAWATAVETMGTFLGQALKARQGAEEWLKFFEVTGSAFAHIERCALVPGYDKLSREETYDRVRIAENELGVLQKLGAFTVAVRLISRKTGSYHLITLDTRQQQVYITPYPHTQLQQAMEEYARQEARAQAAGLEVVLVAAGPVAQLRRAYPNYFMDTTEFISRVRAIIRQPAVTQKSNKSLFD